MGRNNIMIKYDSIVWHTSVHCTRAFNYHSHVKYYLIKFLIITKGRICSLFDNKSYILKKKFNANSDRERNGKKN